MGLIIIGFQGATKGIPADETGINTQAFSCRYFPQFKDFLAGYQGQNRAFAIPDKLDREVTVSGQTAGTNGVMAMQFATAYVFANATNTFTANNVASGGGFYMDDGTVSSTFNGWQEVSIKATASPLIT